MKINKLYRLFTFMCLILFCFCNITMAQTKDTKVSATVVDEQGNPINGVGVYGPKGAKSSTDINGNFTISLKGNEPAVVVKKGYESLLINLSELEGSITLVKSPFLASEDDEIKMGVANKNRLENVGAISSINTKERLAYDNTQWVRDYINGLMLGVKGSDNIRGLGDALFVIDGVIGRDPNILNMEEVEQITILKDANSVALYGSQGRNGVIIINTKRGKSNRKEINVNISSGFRVPVALPKYLGSAKYMELYNEGSRNDGLGNYYDPSLIEEFQTASNEYRYPDLDLYSDEYVKPMINTTNIITEFSGGNDKSKYYVNVGWNRSDSWVKMNPDANAGSNRFNVRGNIDFRVNDWITSSLDGIAIIGTNKSALSNLLKVGTTLKPNAYAPFLPVSMVDMNNPELAAQVEAAGIYDGMLLGATQQFQEDTPIANIVAGGYQNDVTRTTQFNNSINFDLSRITEGLSAKTYLSFDFYDSYKLSNKNRYRVYEPTWEDDKIVGLAPYGDVDLKDLTENVATNGFVSRLGFYGLVNYQKEIAKDHSINTTFLGYYNSMSVNDVLQKDIDSHLGFQMAYDFKKKMFVDFSAAYAHSIKLPEGNRGGLSPTFGIGYILSEEQFIKNIDFIDFLKLKVSGGTILTDRGISYTYKENNKDVTEKYYLYEESYSDGSNFNWADGQSSNRRQNISQGGNPDMGFEERIDLNIGIESYLMNSVWFEFNYFKTELDKQLTILEDIYPSYYGTFRPYDNYDKNLYTGFEIGLNYNKTFDDLTVSLGANVLYSKTEALKRSEANEFDYQNRVGKELSSIFGLVDDGFYSEADFSVDDDGYYVLNEGLAVPNFGAVQPGDIKYLDQNGDNIIDNDDRIEIGQSSSPWTYGVNLNLKYKAFNLFVLGTGQVGGDGNKLNDKFNNYYGVNGNDKYSEVVLGRWTPETASTATFPRLSSQTNQNNFRPSTFWMYDNSFFKVNRIQLTYDFSENLCNKIGLADLSMNLSGTNLFEVAKNKDVRQLTVGGTPQYRAYTLGLRMSF